MRPPKGRAPSETRGSGTDYVVEAMRGQAQEIEELRAELARLRAERKRLRTAVARFRAHVVAHPYDDTEPSEYGRWRGQAWDIMDDTARLVDADDHVAASSTDETEDEDG